MILTSNLKIISSKLHQNLFDKNFSLYSYLYTYCRSLLFETKKVQLCAAFRFQCRHDQMDFIRGPLDPWRSKHGATRKSVSLQRRVISRFPGATLFPFVANNEPPVRSISLGGLASFHDDLKEKIQLASATRSYSSQLQSADKSETCMSCEKEEHSSVTFDSLVHHGGTSVARRDSDLLPFHQTFHILTNESVLVNLEST